MPNLYTHKGMHTSPTHPTRVSAFLPWAWPLLALVDHLCEVRQRPRGCTSQVLGSVCWAALEFCVLFWLLLFLHVECPEGSHTGSLAGRDRSGSMILLWIAESSLGTRLFCSLLWNHTETVFLEGARCGLLVPSRQLPSPFCHPWVLFIRLALGCFIIGPIRGHGRSSGGKVYLCYWPGWGPLRTSDLFSKANVDLWGIPSVSENTDYYFGPLSF